jgi:hypothetical protein
MLLLGSGCRTGSRHGTVTYMVDAKEAYMLHRYYVNSNAASNQRERKSALLINHFNDRRASLAQLLWQGT